MVHTTNITFSHTSITVAYHNLPEGYVSGMQRKSLVSLLGQNLLALCDWYGEVKDSEWEIVVRNHESDLAYYESGMADGIQWPMRYLAQESRDEERENRRRNPHQYDNSWLYAS